MVGLPLHLWSHKVFKVVGDHCGGWIRTEEETELRNCLKWVRILVKSGGDLIPKEVKIKFKGVRFIIQIWDESRTRFYIGEDMGVAAADVRGNPRPKGQ